jgi:hypothetical protein
MLADTVGTTLSPVSATPEALKITKDEPVDEYTDVLKLFPPLVNPVPANTTPARLLFAPGGEYFEPDGGA